MSCLNMAAVCGTRVGGGEERRRNVLYGGWRGGGEGGGGGGVVVNWVSEVFVGGERAAAPLSCLSHELVSEKASAYYETSRLISVMERLNFNLTCVSHA